MPEDHPPAHETGSWKLWLGLPIALGWLLFVLSISFMRGTQRFRRPDDQPDGGPQPWEQVLWGAIGIVCFLALAVALAVPHLFPHGPATPR